MSMKREFAAVAAVAALVAGTAGAPVPASAAVAAMERGARAEAAVHSAKLRLPADAYGRPAAAQRSGAVSLAGERLGADPDTNIRLELARDWWRNR